MDALGRSRSGCLGCVHYGHETCHRFPSHHIGIPILILVSTHFLSRHNYSSCKDIIKSFSRWPKPSLHRLVHNHDHDTIISLRRLPRRLYCRYVISKSPANMGALPGRTHCLCTRLRHPRASSCVTHHPPAPSFPEVKDERNGTESPALPDIKLHLSFRVNAWAGSLTKAAAFWTCAPRRVTV